ncbi:phosphopyruvate hydratase [Candidatus Uhrbacteria bacterium]|nr:phosphopyruvate hydratase [Candidatus Uhrbacteria bacterium]
MAKIKQVHAREILDSRGNPTVEVKITLDNGIKSRAMVPSGASTGTHEAWELRDGDKKRFGGKGVLKACANVNGPIAKKILGMDVTAQRHIDKVMIDLDGTENKKRLGANAILGVSLACLQTGARAAGVGPYKYLRKIFGIHKSDYKMPEVMMNVYNGGRHADNGLSIQEFMIIPHARKMSERVRMGSEIFHSLKAVMHEKQHLLTLVGDEGGFAAKLKDNEHALQLIMEGIKEAHYVAGKDVSLGLDVAASEFFSKGKYFFEPGKTWSSGQMITLIEKWSKKYPLISVEDGLAEDDWANWQILTNKVGNHLQLVGDDLFVTNIERLQKGIDMGVGNAILIKPNQIGSVTETMAAIELAQQNHYKVIVSHRSGETPDTTIADIAVAVNAEYIKTGSLSRSERVAKYNRLMEIEEELGR